MTPDTDRPADMPPWIVETFRYGTAERNGLCHVWSDGTVSMGPTIDGFTVLPRDEAIAACRRVLAILEGDQPTPIT